jgi:uncharacterized protein YyaL (SSP411 family)
VARDILDYVLRDLTGPDGQFYCAEDADSASGQSGDGHKREGAFYVWSSDEIRSLLGDEVASIVSYHYGAEANGNVASDPHGEFRGQNMLYRARTIEETASKFGKGAPDVVRLLAQAREAMRVRREQRPRPHLDDKTLVAWNGLMISAFARAGASLTQENYQQAAINAAQFIEKRLYNAQSKRLKRRWRDGQAGIDAFLDDYAFFIQGLLDLYESTLDIHWLALAIDLQAAQDQLFWDERDGGYFSTDGSDASVIVRGKDDSDNAEPSANSVSAMNLVRLAQMTGDQALRQKAEGVFRLFAERTRQFPAVLPSLLVAFDFSIDKPTQVILAGNPASDDVRVMLRTIHDRYMPNKVVLCADGAEGQRFLGEKLEVVKAITAIDGRATAYVCENYVCQRPVTEAKELAELLVNGSK